MAAAGEQVPNMCFLTGHVPSDKKLEAIINISNQKTILISLVYNVSVSSFITVHRLYEGMGLAMTFCFILLLMMCTSCARFVCVDAGVHRGHRRALLPPGAGGKAGCEPPGVIAGRRALLWIKAARGLWSPGHLSSHLDNTL